MNQKLPKLILASQSPRRRQLFTEAGYEFEVIAPDDSVEREAVSQGLCSKCSPEELVLKSAFVKARVIATEIDSGLILAADTVAHCNAEILGKPVDRDHAEKMLRLMSGTTHQVLTGVCLWHRPSDKFQSHIEMTTLHMDQLSEEQLTEILDSDGWVGKAGAFGYQDGLDWIHIKSGLETTVVGLPIERLDGWFAELMNSVNRT